MLAPIITTLLNAIRVSFVTLSKTPIAMILGVIAATLIARPWIFRFTTVLTWPSTVYFGFPRTEMIYLSATPVIVLQLIVILISVNRALVVLNKKHCYYPSRKENDRHESDKNPMHERREIQPMH